MAQVIWQSSPKLQLARSWSFKTRKPSPKPSVLATDALSRRRLSARLNAHCSSLLPAIIPDQKIRGKRETKKRGCTRSMLGRTERAGGGRRWPFTHPPTPQPIGHKVAQNTAEAGSIKSTQGMGWLPAGAQWARSGFQTRERRTGRWRVG